jgi:YkoY family integral membrane protein
VAQAGKRSWPRRGLLRTALQLLLSCNLAREAISTTQPGLQHYCPYSVLFAFMNPDLQQILDNPAAALAIVGNLIIIESLLSVDNAAVLATMVNDLPKEQRAKALRYGIIGAYVFRGLCLLFASFLIEFWYLKPLGGLYLLYLVYSHFRPKGGSSNDDISKEKSWFYRHTLGIIGPFWATVALIELMDLAFSIDNVFAVVAFTDNLILICTGVFIGILSMRLVAQAFVLLMARYPFLETAAFSVIGILGLKLLLSLVEHYFPEHPFSRFLGSEAADAGLTILTVAIFGLPLLSSWLLNVPRRLGR